jgi:hypothetical protein
VKRLRVALVLVLGGLALASCSLVAVNPAPVHVARSNVPLGLLNRTIPGTNGARVRFVTKPVYFVDLTDRLAPSSRIVASPPTLDSVLRELLLGPSLIETSAGYTTNLPNTLILDGASVRDDVGYIALASPLDTLSVTQQLLAVGQLVYTAYDVGALKGIEIQVGGAVQSLLMPNGKRATLVTTTDFQSLLDA